MSYKSLRTKPLCIACLKHTHLSVREDKNQKIKKNTNAEWPRLSINDMTPLAYTRRGQLCAKTLTLFGVKCDLFCH